MQTNESLFAATPSVQSRRILYTPSAFARQNLLHIQEIGSLTALAPHTSERANLTSCLLLLVCSGSGSLTFGGRTWQLAAGDAAFLDCRRPYSHSTGYASGALWSLQWCHFFGPNLPEIYAKYCERGGAPVFRPRQGGELGTLLSELYTLAGADDYIRDMRINEKLAALLTCVMAESWHPERADGLPREKKMNVQDIRAYMQEHYTEKITLESIAEHFFIDKHYLARLFKMQYGVTVNTCLQQLRITRAKQLLRFTDEKIETIGMECGIGEASYFCRVFKKIEGLSPGEYREMW